MHTLKKSKTMQQFEEDRSRSDFKVKCLIKNGLNVEVMADDEGIVSVNDKSIQAYSY